MTTGRLCALIAGALSVPVFFTPILTINGEAVTLFSQQNYAGFAMVFFGIVCMVMAINNHLKYFFWPAIGVLASSATLGINLQQTLADTLADYENFKKLLASQADAMGEIGSNIKGAEDLVVSWNYGAYLIIVMSFMVILAYFFQRRTAKKNAK